MRRLKEKFSRNVISEIVAPSVYDDEIRALITDWAQSEGWRFENFFEFLELAGVKTPVKLSELNMKNKSFKCVTALNTMVVIKLSIGYGIEHCSEFYIKDGEETKRYGINTNIRRRKGVPKVTLKSKTVTKAGKKINCSYNENFCSIESKVDGLLFLKAEITGPKTIKFYDLKEFKNVEKYLLELDNSVEVSQVYDKLIELLNFSEEELSNSNRISIVLTRKVEKEDILLGKILVHKGKIQEYIFKENEETFQVMKSGCWKYLSPELKLSYFKEKDDYLISISGTEQNITTINIGELIKRIRKKVADTMQNKKII